MTPLVRSCLAFAAAILLAPVSAVAQPAPSSATSAALSPSQLTAIANAYVFTYPLVMNYRTMYMQAIKGDGGFGKWRHLGLSSPTDFDIVTPNNDTPYSYAWVDLRAEPWVLTIPKIEPKRFYTSQWDDLWGYVLDNPGSVLDGNNGHSYLLASSRWKGQLPPGIKRVIRGESDLLGTLTRTQVIGGEQDLPRVKEIQQGYKLQPLSQFLGTKAPAAAPAINWPTWTEGDETREAYWSYVSFLLPFTTRRAADSAMYEKLASLGLKAGAPWTPESLDPGVRAALRQGTEQDAGRDEEAERRGRRRRQVLRHACTGRHQLHEPRDGCLHGYLRQRAESFSVPVNADRRERPGRSTAAKRPTRSSSAKGQLPR